MTDPNRQKDDPVNPAQASEPVVSKPYVMPDDPEEGSAEALAKEVVKAGLRVAAADAEGWRPFVLDLEIRGGWHVNANPASLAFLIPTQVEGTLRRVVYPVGHPLRFRYAREEIKVYTAKAAIRGEAGPAERALRLTYQACDDQRCLPPVHLTVSLP